MAAFALTGCVFRYQEGNTRLVFEDAGANIVFDVSESELSKYRNSTSTTHISTVAGLYHKPTDTIYIADRSKLGNSRYYKYILLHELGHWTGHESRLNRPFGGENSHVEGFIADQVAIKLGKIIRLSVSNLDSIARANKARYDKGLTPEEIKFVDEKSDEAVLFIVDLLSKSGHNPKNVDWVRFARKILIGM